MAEKEDYDSDAPEEFTQDQAIREDEELRNIQKENKARVIREGKERRRQWAQRKTPRSSSKKDENVKDIQDIEQPEETPDDSLASNGMLPSNIVEQLAAREKQVFASDSEDEDEKGNPLARKKKRKSSTGVQPVILKNIPPPECLKSSLEFLKKRKMQVARSNSVLNNSNQALRLLSGMLTKK